MLISLAVRESVLLSREKQERTHRVLPRVSSYVQNYQKFPKFSQIKCTVLH